MSKGKWVKNKVVVWSWVYDDENHNDYGNYTVTQFSNGNLLAEYTKGHGNESWNDSDWFEGKKLDDVLKYMEHRWNLNEED